MDETERILDEHRKRIAGLERSLRGLRAEHEEVREELLRYRRAMEATSAGFIMLDMEHRIVHANPALLDQLGYSTEDVLGREIESLYDRRSLQFYAASREHLSFEALFLDREGRATSMLFNRSRLRDDKGQPVGYAAFLSDLTELKVVQQELQRSREEYRQLSIQDSLTGLYNTRYLYEALDNLIAVCRTEGTVFSLIFMDMDNFKQVVDTYGHLNGSQALKEVAGTLRSGLEEPSFGVAYGGDEFVLVLPGFDKSEARVKAEEIRARMKEADYLTEAGYRVKLGASFGLASFPEDSSSREGLLALADRAMFRIKVSGKDSVGLSS
jgi:diguanylate cyclase (GGDEF)-like protein/PAS domain S-box-containing protein